MATRTDTQSPALHAADSHELRAGDAGEDCQAALRILDLAPLGRSNESWHRHDEYETRQEEGMV